MIEQQEHNVQHYRGTVRRYFAQKLDKANDRAVQIDDAARPSYGHWKRSCVNHTVSIKELRKAE